LNTSHVWKPFRAPESQAADPAAESEGTDQVEEQDPVATASESITEQLAAVKAKVRELVPLKPQELIPLEAEFSASLPVLTGDRAAVSKGLGLPPKIDKLLTRLDGQKPLEAVLRGLSMPREKALILILSLHAGGLVDFRKVEKPEKTDAKSALGAYITGCHEAVTKSDNMFDWFGLHWTETSARIEEVYEQFRSKLSVATAERVSEEEAKQAADVLGRLERAYKQLKSEKGRAKHRRSVLTPPERMQGLNFLQDCLRKAVDAKSTIKCQRVIDRMMELNPQVAKAKLAELRRNPNLTFY